MFHARDRIRLQLILRGKRLGFSLPEIRTIVNMYDEQPGEAGQLQYLLDQIDVRRAELDQLRRDIEETILELAGSRRGAGRTWPGSPDRDRACSRSRAGRGCGVDRGMRYAITGATGFVGGALARQLRARRPRGPGPGPRPARRTR